jgi:hypothetical protein
MPAIDLGLLSAMITPAVLISACGQLIFSTSTRLARIVDRVRQLTPLLEQLFAGEVHEFADERRRQIDEQLAMYADRARLVQHALSSFYLALGLFVATTIAIGVSVYVPALASLPGLLGVLGTLVLFRGCVSLIREARVSLRSIEAELSFTLRLGELYQRKTGAVAPLRRS